MEYGMSRKSSPSSQCRYVDPEGGDTIQVFEMLTGRPLFGRRWGPSYSEDDYHISQMVGILGEKFPEELIKGGRLSADFFDEDGT